MIKKLSRILSARGSLPSCKEIRDNIEELTGKHFFIVSEPGNHNILFRYGNSLPVQGNDGGTNSAQFIQLAANKLLFSRFCQENDIYSPIYHTMEEEPTEFPVIIRTTLTGFGGRGIIKVNDLESYREQMRRAYWWTKFIDCQFEIRVHLFGRNVNRIYKKMLVEGDEQPLPIRNAENGYHFSLSSSPAESFPKAVAIAQRLGELFETMGGTYSAIDMGYDRQTRNYFTFEANSAPGVNTINATEYAAFISERLSL